MFSDTINEDSDNDTDEELREKGWQSFYQGLIELFTIRKTDFDSAINTDNVERFLNNFSVIPSEGANSKFQTVGDYNLINSHPLIGLDSERYFVPIFLLLCEAVYESPYYWMIDDENYKKQALKNRGNVGEEIAYELLSSVFGKGRTYKSLKITAKKGHDTTDIDVLCILGSKALCVQVKSKKLTELSKKGDDKQLKLDFQQAVQDAYRQGLISREKVLQSDAKFIDETGNEIKLPEEIDEVYIMCLTTENYPSLVHQCDALLSKGADEPFPIVLTVFDLEILAYYLNDPYDFLYYIRQRISLMGYFIADEEICFLGYHLVEELQKRPGFDGGLIDTGFGQFIDRNYCPIKDSIKRRWKNEDFDRLCNQLKTLKQAKVTDILFCLLDFSYAAREDVINAMKSTRSRTLYDGKTHSFSTQPNRHFSPRIGVSYISLDSDNIEKLREELLKLSMLRKYKEKGDAWIGFGTLRGSSMIIDAVVFNNQKWSYDEILEKESKLLQGRVERVGRKVGRNEKCPCGSPKKYKHCCLR